MMPILITIVILAIIFDLINGFHDAANSISTIVATRVLTPFQAVLMAAFWNFVGAFVLSLYFLYYGIQLKNTHSHADAHKLLKASVIYLPLLLLLIILDTTF